MLLFNFGFLLLFLFLTRLIQALSGLELKQDTTQIFLLNMASDKKEQFGCKARPSSLLARSHVLSVFPAMMTRPRAMAGSTTQRLSSNMSPLTVQIRYRDGSIGFTAVSNKEEVINTRKKLMDDGWMVMQSQTFLDNDVDRRQIEHNNFLRVDEGTYLPGRFRRSEVGSNSLWVPPSAVTNLQIICVLHLGGPKSTIWNFEYLPPNESVRKIVLLSGTDIIFVAGWMKDWRIPYVHEDATGLLTEIIYVQHRPFV
ncbi:hypothetical protein BJY01DRAFT_16487 [Aspergillus pseudoustus]|uniref:Uncharacterized protein n=1 Tax=Aspergillus pseudoustus TaxID=1810923 RepID=A0ABR4JLA9_9EURO